MISMIPCQLTDIAHILSRCIVCGPLPCDLEARISDADVRTRVTGSVIQ